jgi:AcrR family transcriptional regulator
MAPKVVNKEQKQTEILHAAIVVFAEKGYANSKIIDIANAAQVGKGTIYEYFRSKEEIFVSAFKSMFSETEQALIEELHTLDSPVQKLEFFLSSITNVFLKENGKHIELMMEFWAAGTKRSNPYFLKAIDLKTIFSQFRVLLMGIIEEGIQKKLFQDVNTYSAASLLLSFVDGLLLQWMADKENMNIDKVLKDSFAIITNGLKNHIDPKL